MSEYPLYPYQKRKLFERLKEMFPTDAFLKYLELKLRQIDLGEYPRFSIKVLVKKIAKTEKEVKGCINSYEDYLELAFPENRGVPENWRIEEKQVEKRIEPKYFGFDVETVVPRRINLPYKYRFSIHVPLPRIVMKGKRRLTEYSREYSLELEVTEKQHEYLMRFLTAFFYSPSFHGLDFSKLMINAITKEGKAEPLTELLGNLVLTKAPFQMPLIGKGIWNDTKAILEKFFSYPEILSRLTDQLRDRYPFAWCLTWAGEPIPRRKGICLDTEESILKFFEEEELKTGYPVELYRSVDRRSTNKVDTVVIEFDPPLRMTDTAAVWKQTVEDEERSLQFLFRYGARPESVEENYSGHKSLQRLIHIHPPITHVELRDIQNFLAVVHKFESAKDSYMYTVDKDSSLSRISRELVDYTYGRKKEIKCVPVPNIKREPVHCSIALLFYSKNGEAKFSEDIYNWNVVSGKFSFWSAVINRMERDSELPMEERVYKPMRYYEKHATPPDIFKKMMDENPWYVRAMKEVEPCVLDLYRREWIKESFV